MPVLFAVLIDSAIAKWVQEYRVGYLLTPHTLPQVADELKRLAANPAELSAMRRRCFDVYHRQFSKERQLDLWDEELRTLIA